MINYSNKIWFFFAPLCRFRWWRLSWPYLYEKVSITKTTRGVKCIFRTKKTREWQRVFTDLIPAEGCCNQVLQFNAEKNLLPPTIGKEEIVGRIPTKTKNIKNLLNLFKRGKMNKDFTLKCKTLSQKIKNCCTVINIYFFLLFF